MSGISKWKTGNVTNMDRMLKGAVNFNNDLSEWEVEQLEGRPAEFSEGAPLQEEREPIWNKVEIDPPVEEKPIDPESPEETPEEKPETPTESEPEGEDKPSKPEEEVPGVDDPNFPSKPGGSEEGGEEKPDFDIDDSICPCDGNTIIDFPVSDGYDLMNFRAEARISCFEKQPSVMEPIKK